ncbi:MAG: replication restart helicase PriA [Planctomycetota bacterium]
MPDLDLPSDPDLPLIAEVALDCRGRDAYSYLVGDDLADVLAAGDCVSVPFGPRRERGFVLKLGRWPGPSGVTLKPVLARQEGVRVPPALLRLIRWGAGYYRCNVGTFLAGAVPAAVRKGTRTRPERFVHRVPEFAGELTRRQQSILSEMPLEPILIATACHRVGCAAATIEKMIAAGALALSQKRDVREVHLETPDERHPLTAEQEAAYTAVAASLDGDPATFLLYGVTGSGKTLVYMRLVESVIARGRQALVLLPEIGLTPQLAARFRRRFERVVVWHSGFSEGERAEQWRQVASGQVDLVIGTRSALFAPLPDPGLIVVDEEHDSSYKQDADPRYHGRDMAVVYGAQLGVPVVLGSATPSLESYDNVLRERYRVLLLRERPAGGKLPRPTVVDMRGEYTRTGRPVNVSGELLAALKTVQERGEQAIVLLNRRGWSPVVRCLACGESIQCAQCDISLTYHRGADALRCHYCGHHELMPSSCPTCGEKTLTTRGLGTEQLAATLGDAVPRLRVLRLDADTVGTRQGHAKLLRAFATGEADCLVGTQMVAKGLDFPRVTLVGIVGADQGLNVPDFRAAERTFQLVSQVAGRAGRGQRPGRVVIQAYDVDAAAIGCAIANRVKTFYTHELALRREYGYPPAGGLARFLWRGVDNARVQTVAEEHGALLRQAGSELIILGPSPAGMHFLQGKYRWHALVKAPSRGAIQAFLDRLVALGWLKDRAGVRLAVDVDPYAIQ